MTSPTEGDKDEFFKFLNKEKKISRENKNSTLLISTSLSFEINRPDIINSLKPSSDTTINSFSIRSLPQTPSIKTFLFKTFSLSLSSLFVFFLVIIFIAFVIRNLFLIGTIRKVFTPLAPTLNKVFCFKQYFFSRILGFHLPRRKRK